MLEVIYGKIAKRKKGFYYATFCALLSTFRMGKAQAQKPLLGAIREISPSGGCSLRSKGNKQIKEDAIILSLNDDGKSATMNIDGKDIILSLIREAKQKSGKNSKERYVWVFQENMSRNSKRNSDFVKVTVYLTVVGSGENFVRYNATVKAVKGTRSETIKAEGGCYD